MAAAPSVGLNPKPPDIKTFVQALSSNINVNKSFANPGSSSLIEIIPVSSYKGEPAIIFSKTQIEKLAQPLKYSLIGKFPAGRPSLEVIRKVFATLNLKADINIGLLDPKHILIRLNNEVDYHRIWLKEQWNIYQYPMRVFKWTPSFTPAKECPIIPIWILFPGLPPHLFDRDALKSIARGVGKPLQVDASTASLARPSVARVCVEIDMTKPLAKRIWIGCEDEGYWQQVQYETTPKYCKKCSKFGHEEKSCEKSDHSDYHVTEQRHMGKNTKDTKQKEPSYQNHRLEVNNIKNHEQQQQWVLVTNKKNKNQNFQRYNGRDQHVEKIDTQTDSQQIEDMSKVQGCNTNGNDQRKDKQAKNDRVVSFQIEDCSHAQDYRDGSHAQDYRDCSDVEENMHSIHESPGVNLPIENQGLNVIIDGSDQVQEEVLNVPDQIQAEDQALIDRMELTGQDIMMRGSPKASSATTSKSHKYELESGYASDGKKDVDVELDFNTFSTYLQHHQYFRDKTEGKVNSEENKKSKNTAPTSGSSRVTRSISKSVWSQGNQSTLSQ